MLRRLWSVYEQKAMRLWLLLAKPVVTSLKAILDYTIDRIKVTENRIFERNKKGILPFGKVSLSFLYLEKFDRASGYGA